MVLQCMSFVLIVSSGLLIALPQIPFFHFKNLRISSFALLSCVFKSNRGKNSLLYIHIASYDYR